MAYFLIFLGFLSAIPVAFVFILGFGGEYNGTGDYVLMAIRQAFVLLIFGMIPFSLIYGAYQRLENESGSEAKRHDDDATNPHEPPL